MRRLTKKLLEKSESAFLLSLEIFNKPTVEYRTESFSIFFTNAWELLLKAYLYKTKEGQKLSIFRRKKRNQKRQSLTIDECIRKVFTNELDPVRKNIEYISDIRNESVHLIIEDLNPYFSRVFQRGVLNYLEYLEKWFDFNLSAKFKPGLISLISDEKALVDISVLKNRVNREDFQSIHSWIKRFEELEKLGDKATIQITYSIAIIKNPNKADIVLSTGAKGKEAIILERYRDRDKTHPYRRKEAMEQIIKRLKREKEFTPYDFQSYCFVRGVKKTSKNEYYWKEKYDSGQYSDKLVDEIVTFTNSDSYSRERENIRKKYCNHFRRKRKEKTDSNK